VRSYDIHPHLTRLTITNLIALYIGLGPHLPSPLPPNGLRSLAPHHVSIYHATPVPTVSPEYFAEANQNRTRLYSKSHVFGVDFRGREGYGGDSRAFDSWTQSYLFRKGDYGGVNFRRKEDTEEIPEQPMVELVTYFR
jgi:hypothetical protein